MPEIVGRFWNFSMIAASTLPFVEPFACLIAATTPSIAAAPVTKPPVAGGWWIAVIWPISLLTAALGSSPNTEA